MKKIVLFLMLFTIIISIIAPFCLQSRYYSLAFPLKRFSSYEELKSFVGTGSQVPHNWESTRDLLVSSFGLSGESSTPASTIPDYSTTNIQVEGVDEADILKTDGEYIYAVSGKNVTIVKAFPAEDAEVLSQIRMNGTIQGIYVNKDKLVIFEGGFGFYLSYTLSTSIKVYDVSDRRSPVLKRPLSVNGSYFNSRMIGDYVYVVITQPAYLIENEIPLPIICYGDDAKVVSASEIYYSDVEDYSYEFTTVLAINIQNDKEEPTYKTFTLGATSSMYVSLDNIYITFPEYENTCIYRFHIEENQIECVANGEIPGYVLNQFSMDEHEGYFRVATTTGHIARFLGEATSMNHMYVLDMDLTIVGSLENLAPGEKIYSARFIGDRCYLVTFRKVDPLFVIDLKNPYDPRVLGYLKITGYSDYLHPYDEDHVIGIGKETIAAEEGDFAWYQGVKISLFDVSEVENPKEIAKYEIGDRGTDSPVLTDHKAFLFDRSRSLLVIPVLVAEIDEERYPSGVPPYMHGDYVWQGAYVFSINLESKIVVRGRITHLKNSVEPLEISYGFSSPYYVRRALYIDNVLYTVSDKKIKMNSLENLDELKEVELP